MAGHSRPKDGVALALAYVPAIHVLLLPAAKTWMPGTSPGMTVFNVAHRLLISKDERHAITITAA